MERSGKLGPAFRECPDGSDDNPRCLPLGFEDAGILIGPPRCSGRPLREIGCLAKSRFDDREDCCLLADVDTVEQPGLNGGFYLPQQGLHGRIAIDPIPPQAQLCAEHRKGLDRYTESLHSGDQSAKLIATLRMPGPG